MATPLSTVTPHLAGVMSSANITHYSTQCHGMTVSQPRVVDIRISRACSDQVAALGQYSNQYFSTWCAGRCLHMTRYKYQNMFFIIKCFCGMNNMFAAADGRCLNTLFICHKSLCLVIANNPSGVRLQSHCALFICIIKFELNACTGGRPATGINQIKNYIVTGSNEASCCCCCWGNTLLGCCGQFHEFGEK